MAVKHHVFAVLLAASLAATAGCGASASQPPKAAAPAKPVPATEQAAPAVAAPAHPVSQSLKVTLLFDGPYVGFYAPFYAAVANGYYKKRGLDVRLIPGKGSVSTIEQVGHGNYTFGFADAASSAVAITRGVPVEVVADYLQKSPLAVVYRVARPITSPQDLIGKTVASDPGSASGKLFAALLAANHIPADRVKIDNVTSSSAKVAALAQGKVDGLLGFGIYALPVARARGLKFGQMLFADHGVNMLSNGLIVERSYAKAHPSAVRAFVLATSQGWAFARKHPAQAVKIEDRALTQAGQKPVVGGTDMMRLTLPLSGAVAGHPLGWMSVQSWRQTLATLKTYLGLKHELSPSHYYTDRFVG